MRNVIIGTPSYDGRVEVLYVNSLIETLNMRPQNMQIFPIFIPNDALVQRARNDLFKFAVTAFNGDGVDDLVFIDADIFWNAKDFYRLLDHEVDMVGGLYRQKNDKNQILVYKEKKDTKADENGLLEVNGIGCGFLRISRKAIKKLWNSSQAYNNGDSSSKAVFEVLIDDKEELISEDIVMCRKWLKLEGKIFADTKITCGHIGPKPFIIEKI